MIGLLVLGQRPGVAPAFGIVLVVVAGVGATRGRDGVKPAVASPPTLGGQAGRDAAASVRAGHRQWRGGQRRGSVVRFGAQ